MVKKTIREEISGDWMADLGATAADAVKYFQSLPPNAELYINWHGYDSADGTILLTREETDEEYASRLQFEIEAEEKALKKAAKKRADDQKNIDMSVAHLQEKIDQLLKVRPK